MHTPTRAPSLAPTLKLDRQVTPQVRVRRWSHRGPKPDWPIGAHEGVELALPRRGQVTYRIGSRSFDVEPGQAALVEPGTEHKTSITEELEAISMWIDARVVHEIDGTIGARPRPAAARGGLVLEGVDRLSTLAELLLDEAERHDPGHLLAADALAEAVVVEALRRTKVLAPNPPPFRRRERVASP